MAEARPAGRGHPAGRGRGPRERVTARGPVTARGLVTDRGMVTLELALASLGAAAALVLLAWVLTVVMLLVRCQDTATGIARQEARGDHAAAARVAAAGPERAEVGVRRDRDQVQVTVTLEARPWASWLPSVPLSAEATVIAEPS